MKIMQARALQELSIECRNADVFTLDEEQLSFEGIAFIENSDYLITNKPLVYHSQFTKDRRVIFLANRYKKFKCYSELNVSIVLWFI